VGASSWHRNYSESNETSHRVVNALGVPQIKSG
jgi:hypothetical protein